MTAPSTQTTLQTRLQNKVAIITGGGSGIGQELALRLASEGFDAYWKMKREHLSPRYTSTWDELPKVVAR